MSMLDKIGSLRDRLRERMGRPFGHCVECGKPTRSHMTDGQYNCHRCYSGGNVVLPDGGAEDRFTAPGRQRRSPAMDNDPHAHHQHGTDDQLKREVEEAVADWRQDHDPVPRAEFDRINSALIRNVGEAGELPDGRVNKHFRAAGGEEAGTFACEHDIPMIEVGDDTGFVDLHGLGVEGGFVPILVCLPPGNIEAAAQVQHAVYHDIDQISVERKAVTDGGPEPDAGFYQADADWSHIEYDSFPAWTRDYDAWLPWKFVESTDDEGEIKRRKVPTAENYTDLDEPWSWSDPETLTDFDTAKLWADRHPGMEGVIYIIQDESEEGTHADFADPFVLVDYDDARDPETGEVSPYARKIMDLLGETYTDISQSWEGVHQIFRGSLPEGVTTISFDLPDGSEVEIYDGKRPCAFTGRWVADTPRETKPIDQNALALLAMFHGGVSKPSGAEGEEWEPDLSRSQVAKMEHTENIDDVVDAIKHVTPRDIRLRSKKTGERNDGTLDFDPSWEHSRSGTRLGYDPEIGWIYRKGSIGLDALQVVALEEGIIHSTRDYPTGGDWIEAVDALRDRGAKIPELISEENYPGESEGHEWDPRWTVSVPLSRRAHAISTGWDWVDTDPVIEREEVYERVEKHVEEAMDHGDRAILDSPMSSGKTYSSFKLAAERDDRMTYLTARTDLYEQARGYCDEMGMTYYTLPAVHRDCPTFTGEFGDEWQQRVQDAYERGATPLKIHEEMSPPCVDEHCPYQHKWDFDPDDYDVLIGHFSHANLAHVLAGRHVVVDEYPGDALREFLPQRQLEKTVNAFLDRYGDFPADDYLDVLANRGDDDFEYAARRWFSEFEWEADQNGVFAYDDYHALTPHAIYTIVTSEAAGSANDGYPFEIAHIPNEDRHLGVFERGGEHDETSVHLQVPPRNFHYARSVLALDGTPDHEMWENALGIKLRVRETFSSVEEERSFYHDTLGISVFTTSEHVKPYSSGEYVTERKDRAIAAQIAQDVTDPVVVSSLKAIQEYRDAGWDDEGGPAKELVNFASLRGSNRFAQDGCALITGSTHYGHRWVQREAAFQDMDAYPEGKGNDQDFGDAEDIAYQMREAVILQTILRFGRDERTGAVVYLHTNAVPDEVRVEGSAGAVRANTENQETIFRVCEEIAEHQDAISPADVAQHPSIECSERTVQKTMKQFCEEGVFEARDRDGRRVVYTGWDGEAHRMTPEGEVALPSVESENSDGDHTVVYVPTFGKPSPSSEPTTSEGQIDAPVGVTDGGADALDGPPPG